jgi:2-polyprenyl-3-methyl-5-hydroxy-6-metoxy-1,4-benzoquinol methylase
MIRLTERAAGPELMDQLTADPHELATALHDLRGVNRWLGGWRVLRGCMARMLRRRPRGTYRVLDVGTGSADLTLRSVRWGRWRGYRLRVLATDAHPRTARFARAHVAAEPDIEVGVADALALPFGDHQFDFVLCSTTLHHFDAAEAVRVLREMERVAARGLVVNDLRRSALALAGARLLAATAWRASQFTRHDGPLSVRKAFTPGELRALAQQAGLRGVRVRGHVPWRLSLTLDRTAAG